MIAKLKCWHGQKSIAPIRGENYSLCKHKKQKAEQENGQERRETRENKSRIAKRLTDLFDHTTPSLCHFFAPANTGLNA